MATGKIGVFDSGFGGLSILKEIARAMPKYDYVYLGDTARAPYGDRSQREILSFTKEGIDFLFAKGADLVILACNSASSEALRAIQQKYLKGSKDKKVLGVIVPAAEAAVMHTNSNKIAVIGTKATISSGAFKREIKKINSKIKVFEVPTPLLAPLVEAGKHTDESTKAIIKKYLERALIGKPDTLILGCTHYEILEKEIKKNAKGIKIVSEGKVVAIKLLDYLRRHKEIDEKLSRKKSREFFTTGSKDKFDRLGSRFMGKSITSKKVSIVV